jgi:hypothetical protein
MGAIKSNCEEYYAFPGIGRPSTDLPSFNPGRCDELYFEKMASAAL